MALIRLNQAHLAFGDMPLLRDAQLALHAGERIALLGRNGAGKSTLLKVLQGSQTLDDGSMTCQESLRISTLAQEVTVHEPLCLQALLRRASGEVGEALSAYEQAMQAGDLALAGQWQARIEQLDGWTLDTRIQQLLSEFALDPEALYSSLSGGKQRLANLAAALARQPDVLLLDEPTNHLDLQAIEKLEQLLRHFSGCVVLITHDRAFLRRVATAIVELDRGQLYRYPGDYDNYLRRRQERLHAEAEAQAAFDTKLAQEEVWIRKGIEARRTRNEGRVRALKAMRQEKSQQLQKMQDPGFRMQLASQSGKLVMEAEHIRAQVGERCLFADFSTTILRGDKIGIIGPNGAGKTTLLQILLGQRAPDSGRVRTGTQLSIAYFDQMRSQLDNSQTVAENVSGGRDTIEVDGKPRHIISYLQDFLFSPQRARTPIHKLSGGERNRLLLARLFARPANLLILDEPTNDLDLESLELLENLLVSYSGTLLLVSHDREFVDNVVTSVIAFEPGRLHEHVGGYSDWLAYRQKHVAPAESVPAAQKPAPTTPPAARDKAKIKKLSYKEQRELQAIPNLIHELEKEQEALSLQLSNPDFYRETSEQSGQASARLEEIEAQLETLLIRWEELEARS